MMKTIMMLRNIMLTGVVLLISGMIPVYGAQSNDFWVDALANTPQVKIGASFKVIITAGARQGLVSLPGKNIIIPKCHLVDYKEKDVSRRHEGYLAKQGIYTLKAFALEQVIIPQMKVNIEWANGNTRTAVTYPITVKIESMNPEAGVNLINPRGMKQLPKPWTLIVGLPLLLVSLLLYLIMRKPRKRLDQKKQPAHLTAMAALNTLGQDQVVVDGNAIGYFIELSKLIRRYISDRYNLPALELSRQAIIYALEQKGVEAKRRELINDLLKEADLVKFAMEPVSEKHIASAHGKAREIIELTKDNTVVID